MSIFRFPPPTKLRTQHKQKEIYNVTSNTQIWDYCRASIDSGILDRVRGLCCVTSDGCAVYGRKGPVTATSNAINKEGFMKFFCVTLMLVLLLMFLLAPAYSQQLSYHRLASQESAFGLGLLFFENSRVLSGNLEYGIEKNLKGYAYGSIGFVDDTDLSDGTEIPPAPGGGLGVMHVAPFGTTGFDSFLSLQGTASFARVVDGSTTLQKTRGIGLGGTVGLLKRLPASESGMQITPFFGVKYNHA